MKLTISIYMWLKRFETTLEQVRKDLAATKTKEKVTGADVVAMLTPFLVLRHEYHRYVLPNLKERKRSSTYYKRFCLLVAVMCGGLFVLQVAIFYLAEHSYRRDFLDCWFNHCSRETLYEPLVWLSALGVIVSLIGALAWEKVVEPIRQWLDGRD